MYRLILALLGMIAGLASAQVIPQTVNPNFTSRLLSTPNITQGLMSTPNITQGLLSTPSITKGLLSTPNITPGLVSSPQFSTPPIIPHTFISPGNLNQGMPMPEISPPFIPPP
jgi:hypothetical protein